MNTINNSKDSIAVKAKRYSSIKYILAIVDTAYLLLLLFLFQGSGLSRLLADSTTKLVINNYLAIPVFILIIFIIYYILDFPLNFYRSFILEHKFSLSHQSIRNWSVDEVKRGVISFIISLILLEVFYYILRRSPATWWLLVSILWILFSLILNKLIPVIIIPLFFKYKRLSDDTLRTRVIELADKMKVKMLDVFEIDLSTKTLKANAAFVGIGNTKRIILADTLRDKYSYDEIEVILAHEFAHYRLRHLLKLILINSWAYVLSFYLIFKTGNYFLGIFRLSSLSDISALPIIFIYLIVFGAVSQPFENYISRKLERNADMLALKITGLREAFISLMEKFSLQNLADRNPPTLIKVFFFDHPPINERIAMAEAL